MTKQTTNTLLIIGGVVIVYYLYVKAKTGKTGTTTPGSTSGSGTPHNSGDIFSILSNGLNGAGTLYNNVTNSNLIKGIFGGSNAPSPVTNSPSQSGTSNNASGSLSDLFDNFNTYGDGANTDNYTIPADSGTSDSGLNVSATA